MKALFVVAALLTLALGVAWTFFPRPMLSSWGVQADEVSAYMAVTTRSSARG